MSESFRKKLSRAGQEQRQFTSKHKYSLEEFGLTKAWIQAELGPLLDYYALNGSSGITSPLDLQSVTLCSVPKKRHHATCSKPKVMSRRPFPTTAEAICVPWKL